MTPWGARGWGKSDLDGFNWPRDITYAASSDSLWVADTKNDRLLEFTTAGVSDQTFVGSKATMNWPYGIAASGSEVIETNSFASPGSVEAWNSDGTAAWPQPVTTAYGTALKHPYSIAVSGGIAYVADSGNNRIVQIDASTGAVVGSPIGGTGVLHAPQGIAVDPLTGDLWVADTGFNRLAEFDAAGNLLQTYGGKGGGNGQFFFPTHLAVHADAAGHVYLYVADTYNDRVEILDLNEN
jgi:DNA-binding beta-propeller fold protein YncE